MGVFFHSLARHMLEERLSEGCGGDCWGGGESSGGGPPRAYQQHARDTIHSTGQQRPVRRPPGGGRSDHGLGLLPLEADEPAAAVHRYKGIRADIWPGCIANILMFKRHLIFIALCLHCLPTYAVSLLNPNMYSIYKSVFLKEKLQIFKIFPSLNNN